MKPRLLDFLVCPKDLTELKLVTWNFRPVLISDAHQKLARQMEIEPEKVSKEVFEGVLVNHQRKLIYPIIDSIPRLLLFPSNAMRAFFKKNRNRLEHEFPGYALPDFEFDRTEKENASAFENQIFANEADVTASDKAVLEAISSSLELMLSVKEQPIARRVLLDVGLGLGQVSSYFAKNQKCEMVGMDVSHLVDTVQKSCSSFPFFGLVQASILAPPFRKSTFDLAYSYGGLNRLSVPKEGVSHLTKLPKKNGRLCIWFDDNEQCSMSKMQKVLLKTEQWLRPVVSHLPRKVRSYGIMTCMPIYLMHQKLFTQSETNPGIVGGVKSAIAVAQQRLEKKLSCGFSDSQVKDWVEEQGYRSLQLLKEKNHPLGLPMALWNCAGVEGVRI